MRDLLCTSWLFHFFPLLLAPLWPFSLSLGAGTRWELNGTKHLANQKKAIKLIKTETWYGSGERILNWKAGGLGSSPSSVANSFIHPSIQQHMSSTAMFRHYQGKSCRCSGEEERQCLSSCGAYLPGESQIQRQENIHESIGWQAREWLGGYFSWVVSKGPIWVLTSRLRCGW